MSESDYSSDSEDYPNKKRKFEIKNFYVLPENEEDIHQDPLIDSVKKSNIPSPAKEDIIQKLTEMTMSRNDSDKNKYQSWVRNLLKIPFKKYTRQAKINNNFLLKSRKLLDEAVFGMEDAKEEIIDFLLTPENERGTVLALQGPKGMGKTKICRALSQILNLPLFQISMGGVTDSSVLIGHDYTYTGSKPGKIANIMQQAKCMNPVIYIDEMDKSSSSDKSKDVYGVLTHLLDESQNQEFHDLYFDGVSIDLSKVLFITSFNDPENIDPIVLNRMKIIKVKPYSIPDKVEIVKKFILPGINRHNIKISDEMIRYIVVHKTLQEPGLRNIKKNFQTLFSRLNSIKTIKNCKDRQKIVKNFSYEKILDEICFEDFLTKEIICKILNNNKSNDDISWKMMYI